jgi:hypothetical protein
MRLALFAASLLGLMLIGAAALVLRDRTAARRRVEAFFQRPDKPPKAPGSHHYYRPYWS